MPETGDTDFSWREFVRRNNDELVATYGNLANRVLTFYIRITMVLCLCRRNMTSRARPYWIRLKKHLPGWIDLLINCHFKEAIWAAMTLAQEANRYLDEKAPWKPLSRTQASAKLFMWFCQCLQL